MLRDKECFLTITDLKTNQKLVRKKNTKIRPAKENYVWKTKF